MFSIYHTVISKNKVSLDTVWTTADGHPQPGKWFWPCYDLDLWTL